MELFYNPDVMPERDIKATFVAREGLIDELVSIVERQPEGAGIQHVVIIAPRGMGKTTVLLMTQFAIRDRGLAERWLAVKFPEESYGIYDLADFWTEVLNLIVATTKDEALRTRVENLKSEHPETDELQEAALALIKDWAREHQKRLILLVDNFDMILSQIGDERDNARLRDVLMNDGTMMLVGCAVSFFQEARAYDQPLYNFFKILDLNTLNFEHMRDLLRRRAAIDQLENFDEMLKANEGRLRVLEYFTGGNPRLVLMLYRVITHSDISQVRSALEKLLDEVTPYYKAKIESLPAQQRKILDHIARTSSKTREGLTPGEIATGVRLTPNQTSAQLKRLCDSGYVRAANLRGRASYYTLSEPLYAIWHQMRFGRDSRQRMLWLVDFLKVWYDTEEIYNQSDRLRKQFVDCLQLGHLEKAGETLEYRRYLADALENLTDGSNLIDDITRDQAAVEDHRRANEAFSSGNLDEALDAFDHLLESHPGLFNLWVIRGHLLNLLNRNTEALLSYDRALEIRDDISDAWRFRANCLLFLGRTAEAVESVDRALKFEPESSEAWFVRGCLFGFLRDPQKALSCFDHALQIAPSQEKHWCSRAHALSDLHRYEEALESCNRAIEINSRSHESWYRRGVVFSALERHQEALASLDRAIEINADSNEVWRLRGHVLRELGRLKEALASFDRALEIEPGEEKNLVNRGATLGMLGRFKEALKSFDRALAINSDDDDSWRNRGAVLYYLGRYDEAIASFDSALTLKPDQTELWQYRLLVCLLRFNELIAQHEEGRARHVWKEALNSASHLQEQESNQVILTFLMDAELASLESIRNIVAESDLGEPFFPLVRAIDYVLTRDEALIEKLSPEVRGIVEQIIGRLDAGRENANRSKRKARVRKSKPISGGRRSKRQR